MLKNIASIKGIKYLKRRYSKDSNMTLFIEEIFKV